LALYNRIVGKPLPKNMYRDLTRPYLIFESIGDKVPAGSTQKQTLRRCPSKELELMSVLSCLNKDEMTFLLILMRGTRVGTWKWVESVMNSVLEKQVSLSRWKRARPKHAELLGRT
jgi:hypothetical protein